MIAVILASLFATLISVTPSDYLYKFVMVRAAPGRLLELIDAYHHAGSRSAAFGEVRPFIMRHSQGDQWDLLLIYPLGPSLAEYHAPERVNRRAAANASLQEESETALESLIAWQEDVIVAGPPDEVVAAAFADFSYYHVEMLVALPGKLDELTRERHLENQYSALLGRPENLIFSRRGGAAWQVITIGFYRDIQHFAERTDHTDEERDAIAQSVGFEARDRIGTYLRTLISYHHDTLAGAVRPND